MLKVDAFKKLMMFRRHRHLFRQVETGLLPTELRKWKATPRQHLQQGERRPKTSSLPAWRPPYKISPGHARLTISESASNPVLGATSVTLTPHQTTPPTLVASSSCACPRPTHASPLLIVVHHRALHHQRAHASRAAITKPGHLQRLGHLGVISSDVLLAPPTAERVPPPPRRTTTQTVWHQIRCHRHFYIAKRWSCRCRRCCGCCADSMAPAHHPHRSLVSKRWIWPHGSIPGKCGRAPTGAPCSTPHEPRSRCTSTSTVIRHRL